MSSETIPTLSAYVLEKSCASANSGMPSPSMSWAATLIIRVSPPAITCRSQPGFSYQASSGSRVESAMTSGRPSAFRSAATAWYAPASSVAIVCGTNASGSAAAGGCARAAGAAARIAAAATAPARNASDHRRARHFPSAAAAAAASSARAPLSMLRSA